MQRGVKTFDLQPDDVVKKRNARKRTRMGDTLTSEWIGQYRVVSMNNDTNTVKLLDLHRNVELKRAVPYDQLKPYISHATLSTATPGDQSDGDEADPEEHTTSQTNTPASPAGNLVDEGMQNDAEEENISARSSTESVNQATDSVPHASDQPTDDDDETYSQFHDHVPTVTSFSRYTRIEISAIYMFLLLYI